MTISPELAERVAVLLAEHGDTPAGRQLTRETLVREGAVKPEDALAVVVAIRKSQAKYRKKKDRYLPNQSPTRLTGKRYW